MGPAAYLASDRVKTPQGQGLVSDQASQRWLDQCRVSQVLALALALALALVPELAEEFLRLVRWFRHARDLHRSRHSLATIFQLRRSSSTRPCYALYQANHGATKESLCGRANPRMSAAVLCCCLR